MSKKLEKRENRLLHKAENRALIIRRLVREYRDSFTAETDLKRQDEKNREIEEAVAKYNQVYKALRRIRKKIELKSKDTPCPAVRVFGRR